MIRSRIISGDDYVRAMDINDVIANEHGGDRSASAHIGRELGINVGELLVEASRFATERVTEDLPLEDARQLVALVQVMGALAALRSVRLIELEDAGY